MKTESRSAPGATGDIDPGQPAHGVIAQRLFRRRHGNSRSFSATPEPAPHDPVRRPAQVARLLAFAHHLQGAIDRGDYRDQGDAARQLGLSRARVTQILDLTLLAPDIQEAILFLEAVDGREPVSERALREVVRVEAWGEQRLEACQLCLPRDGGGRGRHAQAC